MKMSIKRKKNPSRKKNKRLRETKLKKSSGWRTRSNTLSNQAKAQAKPTKRPNNERTRPDSSSCSSTKASQIRSPMGLLSKMETRGNRWSSNSCARATASVGGPSTESSATAVK